MFTKSSSNEKKIATVVFASALLCALVIAADELSTTIKNPLGPVSWLRVPLGIFLGIFPVGYLALSFLFPEEEMGIIERIGISFALSISINVISILLANIFLAFPITLARNLLIIMFWNIVFFVLFLFRASFLPAAKEFSEQYGWEFGENQNKFSWLKLFDIMLFSAMFCAIITALAAITRHGQSFNGISNALSLPAAVFLLLFPPGYFVLYFFIPRTQRSAIASLSLVVLLSLLVQLLCALVLFIGGILFSIRFSLPRLLLLSFAIDIIVYCLIFLSERVMPIIYYWLERRQKKW